jgi:hypothetical protein
VGDGVSGAIVGVVEGVAGESLGTVARGVSQAAITSMRTIAARVRGPLVTSIA